MRTSRNVVCAAASLLFALLPCAASQSQPRAAESDTAMVGPWTANRRFGPDNPERDYGGWLRVRGLLRTGSQVTLVGRRGAQTPNLALGMLGRAMGESPMYVFDRLVADPLRLRHFAWAVDRARNPYGGGMALFARDYMKFGQLMLDGGDNDSRC